MFYNKNLFFLGHTFFIVFLIFICSSCSTVKNIRTHRQNIIETFKQGNIKETEKYVKKNDNRKIHLNEELIWSLEEGNIYFYLDDYRKSLSAFDNAEKMIKNHQNNAISEEEKYDTKSKKIYPYNVTVNDEIMMKVYQALDYFALNDSDAGIKKIQAASEIQSNALEKFKKILTEENLSIKEQNKVNKAIVTFNSLLSNKDIKKTYDNAFQKINFTYSDFANPLINYLSAIGYLYKNELKQAYSELNKIYSVNEENIYINRDLLTLANKLKTAPPDNLSELTPYDYSLTSNIVFVIFARGFAPSLIEKKTELALPVISYTRFLYPELNFHKCSIKSLTIHTSDKKNIKTETIADLDSIIAYEYRKKFPILVTIKAVLAITKEKNVNLENNMDDYGRGNIYGFVNMAMIGLSKYALDEADIRCWETLPKEFQIAQLKMPADGVLFIKPTAESIETKNNMIELNPKNRITILYVRAVSPDNLTIKKLKLN